MDVENQVPNLKVKAGKKNAPAVQSSPLKPSNQNVERSVETIYQKKSQIEHILLRPDTYIGSVELYTENQWVYDKDAKHMVNKSVSFVPGLYKIFDEILVNAADNKQRDDTMDQLKVTIDPENNCISVFNNGNGIPVVMHKEEKVYVPELIFGHLLTSSNYNDGEKKVTGGRNGFGAKLANIFSEKFIVETADGKSKYKQIFTNNMADKGKPKVSDCKEGENWTKITFYPDLTKFNMSHLDTDIVDIMSRRVYDVAGCNPTVKVYLNGERVPIKKFADYVNLYTASKDTKVPIIFEQVGPRWEIGITLSDGTFQQTSFVNSIATLKGGQHVNHVADQVTAKVVELVSKKKTNVKPAQVKNHLWIFVRSLIENPAFDSQTKETLNTRPAKFGSKCTLSEDTLKKVAKSGIVEAVMEWAKYKQNSQLEKVKGVKTQKVLGIPKLDDANDAGGRNAEHCTLILTEGDSAKALAVAGLSIVGRDRYGVFPLKGKPLNVREAQHKQLMENQEFTNIKKILGLKHNTKYDSVKGLRYGSVMIMADQDHDGSHIKGLLINMFSHFWPSLLEIPGFLKEFVTPIVKVSKGKQDVRFFTLNEYETWKEDHNDGKGWHIKYYKGLGTNSANEAKEYFSDLSRHMLDFVYDINSDDAVELAFSKKKADQRKEWLGNYDPQAYVDHNQANLNIHDFVHKELVHFSMADNQRSIPCMIDGFKPSQRKILFGCIKRKLKNEIKVAQLAGYVSEHAAYHHGEASLNSTIVNMAQTFVGSNNVNVLFPSGQFGTRLQGGKDAASPRYIFTRLSTITPYLFNELDSDLLNHLTDDGLSIEPQFYMPIIPMVLVNGSDGIGTGWSSTVPNYNPRDLVENIKRLIAGEEPEKLKPWYKGFKGTVETSSKDNSFVISGVIEQISETELRITELPPKMSVQHYKESVLDPLLGLDGKDNKGEAFIKEYKEHHTDVDVSFTIVLDKEKMNLALAEGVHKKFKLTTNMTTSNLVLFNQLGKIQKYSSPEHILKEFFHIRLDYYGKRKDNLVNKLTHEWKRLDNKVRFILAVVEGKLVINNKKKADLIARLRSEGYAAFPPTKKADQATPEDDEDAEEDANQAETAKDYDYLLGMPLWSLTHEKVESLRKEKEDKQNELDRIRLTTPQEMWEVDLDTLLEVLEKVEIDEAAATRKASRPKGKKGATVLKAKKKSAYAEDSDDDDFMDDDDDDYMASKKKKVTKKNVPAPKPSTSFTAVTIAPPKPEPAKAPRVKKTSPKKTSPKQKRAPLTPSPQKDDTELSLFERLMKRKDAFETSPKKRLAESPEEKQVAKKIRSFAFADEDDEISEISKPAKAKKAPARKTTKKVTKSDSDLEMSDMSDAESEKAKPAKKTTKKAAAPRTKAVKASLVPTKKLKADDFDDLLSDDDIDSLLAKPTTTAAKKSKTTAAKAVAKPKAAPAKKASKKKVESEDEYEDDMDDDEIVAAPVAPASRPSRRAAAQVQKYVEEDDEDDDDDDDDEYDDDDDDDDDDDEFEP